MRVAIVGSTGFVGRHVVGEMLSRGWTVRALARDADKAGRVLPTEDDRLELVMGDVLDGETLARLVSGEGEGGVDACVNLIGIIRESASDGVTFDRLHVRAPRALVEACAGAGVGRFVHMSVLGVSEDGPCAYLRTKAEGEGVVRESGLDWTVFRPGLIHGLGGEQTHLIASWCRGEAAPWRFLPYFTRQDTGTVQGDPTGVTADPEVQPVAVGDVAFAVCEALVRSEAIGEVYNLVGPVSLSWPELLVAYRDATPGAVDRLHPWGIDAVQAACLAKAASAAGMGAMLPFDEGMAVMGGLDWTGELAKARAHLGFDPLPFREAMAAYAQDL